MSILAGILLILLVFLSLFMVLIILMQRGSTQGGLGAAMGGGMAESALGAEAATTLSKLTTRVAIGFFVLTFSSYLLILAVDKQEEEAGAMPEIDIPAAVTTSEESATDVLSGLTESIESAATEGEEATDEAAATLDDIVESATEETNN